MMVNKVFKHRGAALPTVLALITVVLIAGLAMGSLSTLSLQFNKRQLNSTRAEMAARSGLAYFVSRVQQFEADEDQQINPLDPKPLAMNEIFPNGLTVTEGEFTTTIHFDSNKEGYYSTDNLAAEEPKIGDPDDDDVPRIPPFGLDLLINVEGPTSNHVYRAVLKRFWPFAVYSKHGSLTLMGQPELQVPNSYSRPTKVEGDVYTEWRVNDDDGNPIVFEGRVKGYGLGEMNSPYKILANLEARTGFQPHRVPYHPLILGMKGHLNMPPIPNSDTNEIYDGSRLAEIHYYYEPESWPQYGDTWPRDWGDTEFSRVDMDLVFPPPSGQSPSIFYNDVGNILEGDLYYSHEADQEVTPVFIPPSSPGAFPDPALDWEVTDGNIQNGELHMRRPPARDPLDSIEDGDAVVAGGFQPLVVSSTGVQGDFLSFISSHASDDGADDWITYDTDADGTIIPAPAFLTETIRLTESEASINGNSQPVSPQYTIEGSVSNQQVLFDKNEKKLFIRESSAGLDLQGVTLHVKGDLNLGASAFEGKDIDGDGDPSDDGIPISGAGATLIVDGQLVLGNAHINAGDQAFVIYAEDIVIKAGGTFHGLLIASRSVTILAQDDAPLHIEGGIACADRDLGGGITIRGATVKHEPRYLKGINGAGDFYLASWRKLE